MICCSPASDIATLQPTLASAAAVQNMLYPILRPHFSCQSLKPQSSRSEISFLPLVYHQVLAACRPQCVRHAVRLEAQEAFVVTAVHLEAVQRARVTQGADLRIVPNRQAEGAAKVP